MGRASKDKRDIYYRKAKEEGFRARSAYKLLQIDEEFSIFEGVTRAVDLCAAPGSWSQVLSQKLIVEKRNRQSASASAAAVNDDGNNNNNGGGGAAAARIVAVDLQEMSPIEGVTILQGDITTVFTAEQIVASLGNAKAQIVICDGAPDVTGLHELDEYVQHQLLLAATNITTFVLEPGGTFVSKIFRGPHTPFLCEKLETFFKAVTVVKPKSSRNTSMECFVLCSGFQLPAGFVPSMINPIKLSEDQLNFLPAVTAASVDSPSRQTEKNSLAKDDDDDNNNNNNNDDQKSSSAASSSLFLPGASFVPIQRRIVPFLACGSFSGYDADVSYSLESGSKSLEPVAPPAASAPYAQALQKQQSNDAPQRRARGGGVDVK